MKQKQIKPILGSQRLERKPYKPLQTQPLQSNKNKIGKSILESAKPRNLKQQDTSPETSNEVVIPIVTSLDLNKLINDVAVLGTSRRIPTSRLTGSGSVHLAPKVVHNTNQSSRFQYFQQTQNSFDMDQNEVQQQARTARLNALTQLQEPMKQ